MFEKQLNRCDCFSLILVLILTYGQDLLHHMTDQSFINIPDLVRRKLEICHL